MGGGDLNLKKAWHPLTYRNQEMVWKREQKVLKEEEATKQLKKEMAAEKDMFELKALQRAHGKLADVPDRIDWMYTMGPSGDNSVTTHEKEAFLLGKKNVDGLLKNTLKDEGLSQEDLFQKTSTSYYGFKANSYRDTANKIREDPLLAIKQKEQAMVSAVINNPYKVKKLVSDDKKDKKKEKKKKKSKKKHRRQSSSSESEDEKESHVKPTSTEKRDKRSKDDDKRRNRSPSPDKRTRRRSASPVSSRNVDRSSPPPRRRHSPPRSSNQDYHNSRHKERRDYHDDRSSHHQDGKSRHYSRGRSRSPERSQQARNSNNQDTERERKLAAMKANAAEVDRERHERIEKAAKEERQEIQQDGKRSKGNGFHKELQRVVDSGNSSADMISRRRAYNSK